jgi:hypothetical protein
MPRRYRGKDIFAWLLRVGFFDVRSEDAADPEEKEVRQPQVSGVGPLGHSISLQSLAKIGAVILGKLDDVSGNIVSLCRDAAAHVAYGDEVSRKMKAMVDRFILHNQSSGLRVSTATIAISMDSGSMKNRGPCTVKECRVRRGYTLLECRGFGSASPASSTG